MDVTYVTDLHLVVLYHRGDVVGYIDFLWMCPFIEGTKDSLWVCSFVKVTTLEYTFARERAECHRFY